MHKKKIKNQNNRDEKPLNGAPFFYFVKRF